MHIGCGANANKPVVKAEYSHYGYLNGSILKDALVCLHRHYWSPYGSFDEMRYLQTDMSNIDDVIGLFSL